MTNSAALALMDKAEWHRKNGSIELSLHCYTTAARTFVEEGDRDMAVFCLKLAHELPLHGPPPPPEAKSEGAAPTEAQASHDSAATPPEADELARQGRYAEAIAAHEARLMDRTANGRYVALRQRQAIAKGVPGIVLFAQNRSASEYIRDVLMGALQAELYYPTLGTHPRDYPIPFFFRVIGQGGAIARLHSDPNDDVLAALRDANIKKFVVHFRDPRQTTLSWIHQAAAMPDQIELHRLLFNPPMPSGISHWPFAERSEWAIANYFPMVVAWMEAWIDAEARLAQEFSTMYTTYESFHDDDNAFISNILRFYDLNPENFELARFLTPRDQHRNFRKGSSDEWRSSFDDEQKDKMKRRLSPSLLARFGWAE